MSESIKKSMPIRRVGVFGGPGSGKSTLAKWLSSEITIAGHDIQYVDEYVKLWAYMGKKPKSFDQVYLFSKQMYKEDSYLNNGTGLIITDSPILMVCSYAMLLGCSFADELISIAKKFDEQYPGIHLFLDRHNIPYRTEGRFQSHEEAIKVDEHIEETMKQHLPSYLKVRTMDRQEILKDVLTRLAPSS